MQDPTVTQSKRFDWRMLVPFWPVILGILCMYVPSYLEAAEVLWVFDDHAHSPLVLLIVLFLFWMKRHEIANIDPKPQVVLGSICLLFGLLLYILGRTQDIYLFDLGSQVPVGFGLLLLLGGWPAVRVLWFPIFFLVFLAPLPSPVLDSLTGPLKGRISEIVESVLYHAGYPIARSGVMLIIGQYQLLVANACSGLNSMFSLSAMGLLYLYLVRHTSIWRNILLILSILPFAFLANVIRVIILVLVTYYFGDEAGQGFVHGFAGMILFAIALILLFAWDAILGLFFKDKKDDNAPTA